MFEFVAEAWQTYQKDNYVFMRDMAVRVMDMIEACIGPQDDRPDKPRRKKW